MYELELKGMPSIGIGESLVLPFSLIEMLRTPMGVRIEADDMYKHGGEIGRWLLSKTPLQNNRKHVVTYLTLHYLEGSYSHVPTTDWHCDGSDVPFLADDIFHTMVCLGDGLDGQLKTEFLTEDKTIYVPDEVRIDNSNHETFRSWITNNADEYGFKPVEAESGRICTWTSRHLHRVQFAKTPHFRLFWKVAESNLLLPKPLEEAFSTSIRANSGDNHRILNRSRLNLEQGERGIIIRGMNIKE